MNVFSLDSYKFDIPKKLIVQRGRIIRDSCRLMVLSRDLPPESPVLEEILFYEVEKYFAPGDVLVLNAVRVAPVRLLGRRETGGKVEVFLLQKKEESGDKNIYFALARPSARLKEGEEVILGGGDRKVRLLKRLGEGKWEVALSFNFRNYGNVPLPPYIKTPVPGYFYNPVYSERDGAVAAPTAGLHFTEPLLSRIADKGVAVKKLYLNVSLGTFKPVKAKDIRKHEMEEESFYVPDDTAEAVNEAVRSGRRVFAVGTTVVRTLESFPRGEVKAGEGKTSLYIVPGFEFKNVSALLTNFHTPGSTLLVLVSAFARKGDEPLEYGYMRIKNSYDIAVKKEYGFFSLGDAMLIL